MGLKVRRGGNGRTSALAISNFLRQHDLVQVLWVTLSPGLTPEHPSETIPDIDRVS
jgi:hypothetical protein